MSIINYLILFLLSLVTTNTTFACFQGYFAPDFLDLTDPIIGSGVLFIIISITINYIRKINALAFLIPTIYLSVSYIGHWTYSGDCGSDIILLNKLAMLIAGIWLLYELRMYYVLRSRPEA